MPIRWTNWRRSGKSWNWKERRYGESSSEFDNEGKGINDVILDRAEHDRIQQIFIL